MKDLFFLSRTLYQRASHLMKQGVLLVMVADGIAPECKRDAMALRSKEGGVTNSVDRPGFKSIVEKVSLSPNFWRLTQY